MVAVSSVTSPPAIRARSRPNASRGLGPPSSAL